MNLVNQQENAFESLYGEHNQKEYEMHTTDNKLIRFLRDRRLNVALKQIQARLNSVSFKGLNALVVCGGAGGEGYFCIRSGIDQVTVSDISENSLKICKTLFPMIDTLRLNGENLALDDNSFDIVIVQDGLHHLPRPTLGFTEMLRVARRFIIVIEPYHSLVGKLIGTEWEVHGDAVNYVFRWNRNLVNQTTKSYLLKNYNSIIVKRIWDHNWVIQKVVGKFPDFIQLHIAKFIYAVLRPLNFAGNMMVAVIDKK